MPLFTKTIAFLALTTPFLRASATPSHDVRSPSIPFAESANTVDLEFHEGTTWLDSPEHNHLGSRMVKTNPGNTLPLFPLAQKYVAPVRIGAQSFLLLVDTGSADTWVADAFYLCGRTFSQSSCELGKTFETKSCDSSAKLVPGVHFAIDYASGARVVGPIMKTQLSLTSNLKFTQDVGLATVVYWSGGNNVTSGILGLGHSALTSKYPGTDLAGNRDIPCPLNGSTEVYDYAGKPHTCNQISYPGVGENLNSSFTLALARAEKGGFFGGSITFGGVPKSTDPTVNVTGQYITVPMEALNYLSSNTLGYHVISVDGIQLPLTFNYTAATTTSRYPVATFAAAKRNVLRHSNSGAHYMPKRSASGSQFRAMSNGTNGKAQFIIDSGSSVNLFPEPIARAINSLFQPPAYKSYGTVYVNCTHLDYIPPVSIKISGVDFPINPEDMVVRDSRQVFDYETEEFTQKEFCLSAIQESIPVDDESGAVLNVLGQPFLKNTMATFDIPNEQIGLVARPYYSSKRV